MPGNPPFSFEWTLGARVADPAATVRAQLAGQRQLHLACGKNLMPGWANIDLDGPPEAIRWNLTRPLPVANASVDCIFNEHFIEHVKRDEALALLRECRRVLVPEGVLRLSTPDLRKLLAEYAARRIDEWHDVQWAPATPCRMLNEGMRMWGHQFLYDEPELRALLAEAGFERIEPRRWRESPHEALRGIECRPFHSELIFEASA